MRLDILSYKELHESTEWRNKHLETLRTPIMLNSTMQNTFFEEVICNRDSPHRYWALKEMEHKLSDDITKPSFLEGEILVGVGGLTNISWENRNAEISLIIDDRYHRQGLGEKAVELLLDQAFNYMNLENIYGEVYYCNEIGVAFWKKIIKEQGAITAILPQRKYYNRKYSASLYFNFNKGDV